MTFDLVWPPSAPQIAKPNSKATPTPRPLRRLDEKILNQLHDAGTCHVWSLLNVVAEAEAPRDRTHARVLRLELLNRIRHLRKAGLVFPVGRNKITASKPDPAGRPMVRRRRPTVARSTSVRAVSAGIAPVPKEVGRQANEVHAQVVVESHDGQYTPPILAETKSAPATELVSEAARQLSRMPRRPKRIWSGWIGPTRSYCGMPIRLATGEAVFAFGALRGRVIWSRKPGELTNSLDGAGIYWGLLSAGAVEIVKNAHAVRLGRQKRGVRERRSEAKKTSARRNAHLPPREGRRPRGRPRNVTLS